MSSMTKMTASRTDGPRGTGCDLAQAFAQEPLLEGGGLGRVGQIESRAGCRAVASTGSRSRSTLAHRLAETRDDEVGVVVCVESEADRARSRGTGSTASTPRTPRSGSARRGSRSSGRRPPRRAASCPSRAPPRPRRWTPCPAARAFDGVEQRPELRLPAEERHATVVRLLDADGRADDGRLHRLGLALGGERRDRRGLEDRSRAVEDDLRREDLAGSALLMTRAAVLIASPKTRYARRYGGPKSPVKTLPVLTPTRIGTTPSFSMISRSVRSIRSSSWPVLEGAPAVRRALTLDLPTSVS